MKSREETLWMIIFAIGFILLNAYWYDRHDQKLEKILKVFSEKRQIRLLQEKHRIIKDFLLNTGMADEEWLENH